ncbi:MAG: 3'(2'),5'-bisphosphate nucleotidase CysQ [Gemmobacter sp.]
MDDDLALLVSAAEEAGRIALRYWKQSPRVWDKGHGAGPVTEADIAVNDMLQARLCAARPGYGWLSEETPDTPDRLSRARVFVIDPIDGTRAFIAGEPAFAHALAVVEAGQVVAGVVALPAKALLYAATLDGPATCNGVPIRAADPGLAEGTRILAPAAALAPEHWPGGVPPVTRHFRPSLAYRMCLVADGSFAATMTARPAWEWDIAAGALIAGRAGVTVTDHNGAALDFNRPDPRSAGLLVAAPALHRQLMLRRRGA